MASISGEGVHCLATAATLPLLPGEGPLFVQPQPPPHPTHSVPLQAAPPPSPSPQPPPSSLEALPVEILAHILTCLTHPRSHLPGLTESQSAHDFPAPTRSSIKAAEDLTQPPSTPHWAADLFSLRLLSHPFHALSLTSRRCHAAVESHCVHLVRVCNGTMFNLPFAHLDRYGPHCVYPDLSGIVYRRLWLQHAPRRCVYCHAVIDRYPFSVLKRLMTSCQDCFYRQTLSIQEIKDQYHIRPAAIIASPRIRCVADFALRIDVEALALQLYRTRQFHSARVEQLGKPCALCAITRFTAERDAAVLKVGVGKQRRRSGKRGR